MHRSRHWEGRDSNTRTDESRLRFDNDPPAPFRFPGDSGSETTSDDVIRDVEAALDFTQQKLDDLRMMLEPFPNDDDPPRAA